MTLTAALAIVLADDSASLTPEQQKREWQAKAQGKAFALFDKVRRSRNLSRKRLAACDLADVTAWLKREDRKLIVGQATLRAHLVEYVMGETTEPTLAASIPAAFAHPATAAPTRPPSASR